MAEYIRNNKLLVFIISILLVSNLVLLFFFLKGDKRQKGHEETGSKPPPSMRDFMKQTLKDSVGFNDEQVAKYDELREAHKKVIKPLFEEIKHTKDSLYKMLMDPAVSDSSVNSMLDKIGNDQRNIDQKIYMHFRSLRELCSEEQKPKFDSVTQRVIKKMIAGPSRKGGDKDKKK